MEDQIKKAVKILREGGIVIFPTDTAFGIGCRIDNVAAIKRLFSLRRRPETQATPVLVSGAAMAKEYLRSIPEDVQDKLINTYWPGALTIILPSQIDKVPELVRGGGQNLGVRMPNNQTILTIIKDLGIPILGPSANFNKEQTPYAFSELDPELTKLVDYIVEGECSVKQASTVIDCSVKPWKILRQGAVTIKLP